MNEHRVGTPNPLQSDQGWGGGQDVWDIVDGKTYYPWWSEGLAFLPGGRKQLTIDFGASVRFNEITIWHHTDCCAPGHNIPKDIRLEYFDGMWKRIRFFNRDYDITTHPPAGSHGSYADRYYFAEVVGQRMRWSYDGNGESILGNSGDWHGWVYEVEVLGEIKTDYAIELSAFIPGNNVPAVGPWSIGCAQFLLYFRGDTRGFEAGAPSFRARQTVAVELDNLVSISGIGAAGMENRVGKSRLYAENALPILDDQDDDPVLNDCDLLHAKRRGDNRDMKAQVRRTGPMEVEVLLIGSARNPLVPFAPSIDWELLLHMDASTVPIHWTLEGVEDGFPAFEIYIDQVPIYRRNSPPPYSASDLTKLVDGVGDVPVLEAGDL